MKQQLVRQQSFYYNLRRFHNWIKRNLINTYARNSNKLLDMASGKGGDLQKWFDSGIHYVEGYDIHGASIDEANRRLHQLQERGHTNAYVSFNVKDLSKEVLPAPSTPFDVVTCMFAAHYFFQSPDTFNTFAQSITNNLKVGGYFICCLFDGQRIIHKLNSGSFLTHNFALTPRNVFNLSQPFGNKVGVLMRDTVLDSETNEYIVDPNHFRNLMESKGMTLVSSVSFDQEYMRWIQEKNPPLNVFEQEVSFLNRYYVFQRKF